MSELEPTDLEQTYMEHIKANASAWRWKASEILASAQAFADLDPYNLSRLPDLLQAEIDKHRAKKETT